MKGKGMGVMKLGVKYYGWTISSGTIWKELACIERVGNGGEGDEARVGCGWVIFLG